MIDKTQLQPAKLNQVAVFQAMRFAQTKERTLRSAQVFDVNPFPELGKPGMLRRNRRIATQSDFALLAGNHAGVVQPIALSQSAVDPNTYNRESHAHFSRLLRVLRSKDRGFMPA